MYVGTFAVTVKEKNSISLYDKGASTIDVIVTNAIRLWHYLL